MTPEEINDLNKKLRKYDGDNEFVKSCKRALGRSRSYFELNGRSMKCLSDKQYSAIKSSL